MFLKNDFDEEVLEKTSGKASGKTSGRIIELMKENENITIPEIADMLSKSTRAIEMSIAKLKKIGMIRREGSAKGGYWKVIER